MIQCEGRVPTRETLFNEFGALCTRACRRFVRPGLDKADLYQIAAIGLIKACDRYDPAAATPFEPFAWLFIIGELMHFVRDGETIVLGGLLRDIDSESVTRVPGLSSIPVFGKLFQDRQRSHQRDEVIFLITPHILRTASK